MMTRPHVDPVPSVMGARPGWLHYGTSLPAEVLVWIGTKEALGIKCSDGTNPRNTGEFIATSNTDMVQCGHCKRTMVFQNAVAELRVPF